jgi:stalled ribosome rescue protein Dom34
MTTFHAVVWMDHSQAHVLMFDKEHVEAQRVKARSHHTPKHGHVGADKDFFKQVADALAGVSEVLLTGPANAKIEFRDFCKHNAHAVDKAIVDVVNSDHPSDPQLVAMAKQYFVKFDQKAPDPTQR